MYISFAKFCNPKAAVPSFYGFLLPFFDREYYLLHIVKRNSGIILFASSKSVRLMEETTNRRINS
jgi:hypothetical protein